MMLTPRLFLLGCLSIGAGVIISINIIDSVKQHYKAKEAAAEEARSDAYHDEMMHERKMRLIQRFGEEVAAEAELKQLKEAEAEWRKDPTRGWDDMPTLEKLRQQKSVK